jgi:hypothetical protein
MLAGGIRGADGAAWGWGKIQRDGMRLLRTLLFAFLTLPVSIAAAQNVQQHSLGMSLPTVSAYSLDRAKVTLPADFAAPWNLLVLCFTRDQQPTVESWIAILKSGGNAQSWVLPISGRESGLYRWWLNASLRGNLPPTLPRHYWVPLYINKTPFLRSLQISSEKEVVVLLTDKSGKVIWRSMGAVTEEKKAALQAMVRQPVHP